ncbi:MAG: HAD family hydrolase [Lachnospiraceae bacterium]|nr:HAD family hydrolase [Lachnospiraceae bacterium]
MYKNYLFDLYGTLADIHTDEWAEEFWGKIAELYTEKGAKYTAGEINKKYGDLVEEQKGIVGNAHPEFEYIDIKIEEVFKRLYELKKIPVNTELVLATAKRFREISREYIKLYDGIEELLDDLKKAGKKIYLLTNAQRVFTWDELGLLGIRDKFDGIVISSDEGCCKPDPAFFNVMLKRYSLNPKETIMVGNDPTADIMGAVQVGLDSLYIHTNISPELRELPKSTYIIENGDTTKMRDYLL